MTKQEGTTVNKVQGPLAHAGLARYIMLTQFSPVFSVVLLRSVSVVADGTWSSFGLPMILQGNSTVVFVLHGNDISASGVSGSSSPHTALVNVPHQLVGARVGNPEDFHLSSQSQQGR